MHKFNKKKYKPLPVGKIIIGKHGFNKKDLVEIINKALPTSIDLMEEGYKEQVKSEERIVAFIREQKKRNVILKNGILWLYRLVELVS